MCEEFVWNHIVVCILDGKLSKNLQMLDTLTLVEATNRVKEFWASFGSMSCTIYVPEKHIEVSKSNRSEPQPGCKSFVKQNF